MAFHIKVPKENAERVIRALNATSELNRLYSVQKWGDYILIPVIAVDRKHESLAGYEIVDIDPLERKRKPQPASIRGSYDAIGRIAIIKIRNDKKALDLARYLYESGNFDCVFRDHGVTGDLRLRDLEILQGKEQYVTDHRENGIIMRVNVSRVYFSPRLATERLLLAKSCREGELVLDMFAGIGPFAVTIAKTSGARVIAIDKNPEAVAWMRYNIQRNRVGRLVSTRLMDSLKVSDLGLRFHRIVMNLPHDVLGYIDTALSVLKEGGLINLYMIGDTSKVAEVMSLLAHKGLKVVSKRMVHGYSPREALYSLELRRNR
ncbi:50S ribosomal protein L11 methyltransferase [Thermoplasmatales archaeon AK]|nr:50S ribosomal protein L11 methyltransferase [Thermoplasmatales archaeon AK]